MSKKNGILFDRLVDVMKHAKAVAVYEDPPGNWVKHFFGPDDKIALPPRIDQSGVRWFDTTDEAIAFANKKGDIANGGDN